MLYLDLAIAWLVLPVLVFALLLGAGRGMHFVWVGFFVSLRRLSAPIF